MRYSGLFTALITFGLLVTMSIGCQDKPSPASPTPTPSPAPALAPTPTETDEVSTQGSIWDNMPLSVIQPEVDRGNQSIPEQRGEWSKTEWRYFHTPEALPTMRNYFKREMPKNAWVQEEWIDDGDTSLSYWTSNSGVDGAMVWIVPKEPGTFIALARSTNQ